MKAGILRIPNLDLKLRQVLQGHAQAEALEILVLLIQGPILASLQYLNQLWHTGQCSHAHKYCRFTPDLLGQVEDLCVEVCQLARIVELFGHAFNQ